MQPKPLAVLIAEIEFDSTPDVVGMGRIKVNGRYFGLPAPVIDALATLERDAARYRWLKGRPATIHFDSAIAFIPPSSLRKVYVRMIGHTELDAAIDSALNPAESTQEPQT